MGKCPPIVIFLILATFPIVGIALLALDVWLFFAMLGLGESLGFVILWFVFIAGIAIFCLCVGAAFISRGLVRYKICSEGLWAKYPIEKLKLIPWEKFQEVCVCYAARTTRGEPRAHKVICCIMKGEKKNGYVRWKTDNPFMHRRVITMDYSTELYEAIKETCPHEIVDLRMPWEIKQFERG